MKGKFSKYFKIKKYNFRKKKIKALEKSLSYVKSKGITRKKNNETSDEVKIEEKQNETILDGGSHPPHNRSDQTYR